MKKVAEQHIFTKCCKCNTFEVISDLVHDFMHFNALKIIKKIKKNKNTCCSHIDQKYNEELSTIVCRQRLLRKRGHAQTKGSPLVTRIFL